MSTLITAVLTYHCGWVSSVAPVISLTSSAGTEEEEIIQRKFAKLSEISKYYPYVS